MKKFLQLIALFALTSTGAWAEELTISLTTGKYNNPNNGINIKFWQNTWTSNQTNPLFTFISYNSGTTNVVGGFNFADIPTNGAAIANLTDEQKQCSYSTGKDYTLTCSNNSYGISQLQFTYVSGTPTTITADGTEGVFTVSGMGTDEVVFTVSEAVKVLDVVVTYGIDYTTSFNADILPWIESIDNNGYFTLDPTNTDVQALQTAYNNHTGDTWSETEYNNLLDLLTAAKASENAYIMPKTGYYRIKSNGEKGRPVGYIGYSQTTLPNYLNRGVGLRNIAIADAATDASTILKLTKVEGGYTISTEGLYVMDQETQGQLFPATDVAENAAVFVPKIRETIPGQAFFGTATNSKQWGFHNSDWNAIVGWENTEPSNWILEDATTLELPLTNIDGKYYATTCLPFPVKLSEEAAYKVTISGKKAVEEPIGDVIPANIPVLLISDDSPTLTATIQETTATVDCGDLKGVRVKTAKANLQGETPVVLNQKNGKVGFYKLADGSSLSANRAYLSYVEGSTPASAKAFFEEGFELGGNEATAIENIENGAFENGAVYNLQGQRVVKAQKGVFIQNGKKVVMK